MLLLLRYPNPKSKNYENENLHFTGARQLYAERTI